MSQSTNRILIIIFGLFTAVVHLVLLGTGTHGFLQIAFILNGLSYLTLLGAFIFHFPKGREKLVHYGFMAFALVTILAWVALGTRDVLGFSTKGIEILLIIFLWLDLKNLPAGKQS